MNILHPSSYSNGKQSKKLAEASGTIPVKRQSVSQLHGDTYSLETLFFILTGYLSTTPFSLYSKTKRFGDWILSPSSGNTYSV
jgi:hypothetical protein